MLTSKKGIQPHIIIIALISLIMSFFLMFILGIVYEEDHENCKLVSYEIIDACKRGNTGEVFLTIQNNKGLTQHLDIKGRSDIQSVSIPSLSIQNVEIKAGERLEILPKVDTGLNVYQCKSKTEELNTITMRRC